MIIQCVSEENANQAYKALNTKLGSICEINKEQIVHPKVKVVSIDNFEKMDDKKLAEDINIRNLNGHNNTFVHKYKK